MTKIFLWETWPTKRHHETVTLCSLDWNHRISFLSNSFLAKKRRGRKGSTFCPNVFCHPFSPRQPGVLNGLVASPVCAKCWCEGLSGGNSQSTLLHKYWTPGSWIIVISIPALEQNMHYDVVSHILDNQSSIIKTIHQTNLYGVFVPQCFIMHHPRTRLKTPDLLRWLSKGCSFNSWPRNQWESWHWLARICCWISDVVFLGDESACRNRWCAFSCFWWWNIPYSML